MSNENKINKLKEYIKTLVSEVLNEQDNETPSHFGGGENINVFGYDTKHFDICKSAVILFEKLIKVIDAQSEKTEKIKEKTIEAAKIVDELFGIEKEVVSNQSADSEQLDKSLEIVSLFSYMIGVIGGKMKMDLSREIAFITMHHEEIQKRFKVDMEEASTTTSAGVNVGGPGHYFTPFAFYGGRKKDKKKKKKIATAAGMKPVNEDYSAMFIEISKAIKVNRPDELNAIRDLADEYDIGRVLYMARTNEKGLRKAVADRVKERKQFIKGKNLRELKEGRYHDWRNDESMTPKQKIGKSMREIRDALNELDKTVKMNLKLKTELNMKSEDYWKNTHKALTKISERLVKMANKVGNLK